MQKQHKHIALTAISLMAIAGGGYFLWRYFKKPSLSDHTLPTKGNTSVPTVPAPANAFPLKNGSPKSDLVKQLQTYLGVTADGLFGLKTQAALLQKTGKTQIASQSEYNAVIQQLVNAAKVSSGASRADQLINDWSKGNVQLMPTSNVKAYCVMEDAYGALTAVPSKDITLKANQKLNRTDYVPLSSTSQGYLKFSITSGALAGLYKVDPAKMTVS
jgi:hypothetical protein